MSGNINGGRLAAETNKARYGEDYYAVIGAIGGTRGHTGGFYQNRDLASICGSLGGRMSRRGKNKLTLKERQKIRREFDKAYEELLAIHKKAQREREAYKRYGNEAVTVYNRKRGLVGANKA